MPQNKGRNSLKAEHDMVGNLAKKRKEESEMLLAEIGKKDESIAQLKQKDNNLMLKIIELQQC